MTNNGRKAAGAPGATVVYLRVSTEEQRERQSIQTQREFAERWCELHQIPLSAFYADDGVSGTLPLDTRPEGARLLQDARDGTISTVLVFKLDRLGRDPRLTLNAVADLEAAGAQIKSMTEPFDTGTPSGRFLLTILSGVAGLERETIIERSVEGTSRLARQGVWLGGIVPYGYRVEGGKRDARLLPCDEALPGLDMTEADVVRMMYGMAANEGASCVVIADRLNQLGVPPAYTRDGREVLRGKRSQVTSGIWRPSRVRNILVSSTYRGVHQYGKRSKRRRDLIERAVPALVSPDTWERTQLTLRKNLLFSRRNARRRYLLRGLVKCGLCGLTYIGTSYSTVDGTERSYYVCNGKQNARGIYGLQGTRCPSTSVSGALEDQVWADIEEFLRNPGEVLEQLRELSEGKTRTVEELEGEARKIERAMEMKADERDTVVGLFRRQRIDASTLDRQLDAIAAEEDALKAELAELRARANQGEIARERLESASALLRELNRRLDVELTWELKRELVEKLVAEVRVDTEEADGRRRAVVTVTYRFSETHADRDRTDGPELPPNAEPRNGGLLYARRHSI